MPRSCWHPFAVAVLVRAAVLLAACGLAYPHGAQVWSDVNLYHSWAADAWSGHVPVDERWQYPPGALIFPLLTGVGDHLLVMVALVMLADVTLLAVLASRGTRPVAGLWLWVFAPALTGPIWFARFDVPVAVLTATGLLVAARSPKTAGILIGVGAWLKLWPVLLLTALPQPGRRRVIGAGVATILTLTSIMIGVFGLEAVTGFTGNQTNRGVQIESTPATPGLWIAHETVYRYGSHEIVYPHAGLVAAILLGVGVISVGLLLWRWHQGRIGAGFADVGVVVVLLFVCTGRVFSPQYMIWVFAVLAAALALPGSRLRPLLIPLGVVAVLGQWVYPANYGALLNAEPVAVIAQTARIAILAATTVWAYRAVWHRGV